MSIESEIKSLTAAVKELTAALLNRPVGVKTIAEALEHEQFGDRGPSASPSPAPTQQPAAAPTAPAAATQAAPQTATVAPAAQPASEPAKPAAPEVDKAQLVKVVTEIATALGRNAVIEVLKRYGAESVPTLKPEHYGAVHAELVALRPNSLV